MNEVVRPCLEEVRLRQIGTEERLRVKEYKSIEHVGKLPLANTLCQKIL